MSLSFNHPQSSLFVPAILEAPTPSPDPIWCVDIVTQWTRAGAPFDCAVVFAPQREFELSSLVGERVDVTSIIILLESAVRRLGAPESLIVPRELKSRLGRLEKWAAVGGLDFAWSATGQRYRPKATKAGGTWRSAEGAADIIGRDGWSSNPDRGIELLFRDEELHSRATSAATVQ